MYYSNSILIVRRIPPCWAFSDLGTMIFGISGVDYPIFHANPILNPGCEHLLMNSEHPLFNIFRPRDLAHRLHHGRKPLGACGKYIASRGNVQDVKSRQCTGCQIAAKYRMSNRGKVQDVKSRQSTGMATSRSTGWRVAAKYRVLILLGGAGWLC